MRAAKVRLDSAGLAKTLNSPAVRKATRKLAEDVAAGAAPGATASGEEITVRVDEYVAQGGRLRSPRPGFAVTLAHPAGLRVEAKRAPLVKAATAAGLRVNAKEVA